jgi:5-methyltetrahydrofolate--homocysteine methyltransferase
VFRLLGAPSIGLRLSGGYAVEPEQSTLAIAAHHPQAVYFGMKSGFLPKSERQAADELIAGTDRDPTRLSELPDADPEDSGEPSGQAGAEQPALA